MNNTSRPLKPQDVIEGTIDNLAFGGEGILRHEGFVIFVPFTAPGDTIRCRIQKVKKSFATATLEEVLQNGPHRTVPLCPYFGTCGGCQIQHIDASEQMRYKVQSVQDAFKRIGHLSLPPMMVYPANLKWAYRRHVTLHLRPKDESFEAGYIGIDDRSLVVIETCPIFNLADDPIIHNIQKLVSQLPNTQRQKGKLMILKNQNHHYILSFHFEQKLPFSIDQWKRLIGQYSQIAGAIISSPGQEYKIGNPYCLQDLEDLTFRFTPQAFVQNHPEQSLKIYQHICQLTTSGQKNILDLYCGFGITSLLLARQGHQVTGIEVNPKAIEFAKANATANHLTSVKFERGDVEEWMPRLTTPYPDLVLMNPPRTGLSDGVVQALLKLKPKEMIYISCMPSTLARDLAKLCQSAYQVKECAVYDMFPQTAHVETLVYLQAQQS